MTKNKDFTYNHALKTYGMASEEVFLAATCALGQTLVFVLGTLATCKRHLLHTNELSPSSYGNVYNYLLSL